jgi:polyphosphate kinase
VVDRQMTEMPDMAPERSTHDGLGRHQRQPDQGGGGGDEPRTVAPTTPLASLDRRVLFVNRELSWLAFNRRVLEEALDPQNPLLERVKFLAIASTNLDEFFEIRVAGIMEMIDAGLMGESHDGIKPAEELERVRADSHAFAAAMHRTWSEGLLPELVAAGIRFPTWRQLSGKQQKWVDAYFEREVYPILTPLAVDTAHPFPVLLNKSLNLVVGEPEGEKVFPSPRLCGR